MASPTTVDIHAHFFPESYLKIIEDIGAPFGARVDRSNPKGPVIVTRDARTAPLDASYWDLDLRRKAMNKARIDVHALSLTAPMVYFADGEVGTRLAVAVNNAMSEAHRVFPDRFVGCATAGVAPDGACCAYFCSATRTNADPNRLPFRSSTARR